MSEIDLTFFEFGRKTNRNGLAANLPPGIDSKDKLLRTLAQQLKFPDYFGMNWDALNDCLCDFDWTDKPEIYLLHQDVPLMNDKKEQCTYLEILTEATQIWRKEPYKEFIVSFPLDAKAYLESISL